MGRSPPLPHHMIAQVGCEPVPVCIPVPVCLCASVCVSMCVSLCLCIQVYPCVSVYIINYTCLIGLLQGLIKQVNSRKSIGAEPGTF